MAIVLLPLSADQVYERLLEQATSPLALTAVPAGSGIYALIDHEKQIRYIGKTVSATTSFQDRINGKHTTGSETRSHKFSHAYNTGRMWRSRTPHPLQVPEHGLSAKKLRAYFCRRFCRAVVVTFERMPSEKAFADGMIVLERQVQRLAPSSMMAWGDRRDFAPVVEPSALVDLAIKEGPFSENERAAFAAQQALYEQLVLCRR